MDSADEPTPAQLTRDDCPTCAELRSWRCASGPDGVLVRVREMLALVGSGFEEEPAASTPERMRWSDLPPHMLTEELVRVGPPMMFRLQSQVQLGCQSCHRTFRQSWSYDRGAEHFSIWT